MVLSIDTGFRKGLIENIESEVVAKEVVPLEKRSILGKALAEGEWISTVELVPSHGDRSKRDNRKISNTEK